MQNTSRDPATPEDAAIWAAWHGAGWIDVADPDEVWIPVWQNEDSDYYVAQSYTVVGTDGVVVYRGNGKTSSTLTELTDAAEAAP